MSVLAEPGPVEELKREFTPLQQKAMASTARYLLFGGGAGGGKTEWAIFDGLGLNNPGDGMRAIDFPTYTGIFLRRKVKQLEDVINRSKEIYRAFGRCPRTGKEPEFFEQKKMWRFPSGARIFFGYVDRPSDVENYQGWEYQWVCFEELTQFPTSYAMDYLHSRLRKKDDLPLHVGIRATCNPGGVGHQWVRNFWQISDAGDPNHFVVPTEITVDGETSIHNLARQFVPARLDDNPYLDRHAYALSLANQTEQMKRALREGRWDVVDLKGVIYADQIAELHQRGGIREVPYDARYPVNTFWDLAVSDTVSVWFHQRINGVDHFIDYYQAQHRGMKDHWNELKARKYNYGIFFFPHDAEMRRHNVGGDIATIAEIAEDLGMRPIEIVPRTLSLRQGIEQTRIAMVSCIFDGRCEEGVVALSNYRYSEKDGLTGQKPVHDKHSHGADAFRQFAQVYNELDDFVANVEEVEEEHDYDIPPMRQWGRKGEPFRRGSGSARRWLV